jgi:four helix bundle protein
MIYDLAGLAGMQRYGQNQVHMTREELAERTMLFALRVLKMAERLPRTSAGLTVSRQISRCGTSVAANYRAALRARSRKDFRHKIGVVLEEIDESAFWIELIDRASLLPSRRLTSLRQEADELIRIFSATRASAGNHKS